ncbi:two-component response regulator arr1 [Quercus suber]|uniref:Two-component response regulator arr1 n=1 Tax=Quercus suber TaxID=58331 RepID=A0AAW0KJL0_QUESU
MFRMKNEGSALLRESDTTFNNFPLGLSVLIVDHDQQSLQEMEANLRRFGYEVTECNRVEDASTLLRMEGSVFHIIIIEQCLLGVNEFELLRIVREIDLPVIDATPKKILQLLQSNFKGFEDVDREKISSHLQKYRDSIKRKAQLHMLGYRDKDGTSSEHIQSIYQMKEHPPMTLVDQVLKTMVANEPDILLQQQQAPAAKNTQGFRSVTLPFESNLPTIGGSTSCGNQSNALMTQMDEAFSSEQMRNEFTGGQPFVYENFLNDIDASTNDISGDPDFFSINAPLLCPRHIDHGELGFSSDGIFENFTGDVTACEHFNNL